ncbi:L-allo-threonine aldolase [Leptopilina heterotoma]|uniref:L-allo-threonine aldolase n=1 Tax=Leptopilina heterotoma TaxID=63436 RepID=UPI001CA93DE2|nr:L-allo-threonine aldolase [Leptopilina heterotoma]XP_043472322.1 L-allo-threonine aldolase [Leptopilina heterotoma]XP_043472323.1 L-allo-threonine aldolase [Leptopilina heterotoma]
MYVQIETETSVDNNVTLVDLRSDTISKPSKSMRKAMSLAEVGDDVFGEDPTVKRLEEHAAMLVGKEAAIFVTSGTMGNLIAIMNHCNIRGCEAYCGEDSHVMLHEQGGAAQIAGVTLCPLPNNTDGTFDLKKLQSKIKGDRQHEPISKLVIVENTFNGKIVPQSWINELSSITKKHSLKLHMDGARIWNASIASKIAVKDIVSHFDSVTFCLSKGLGAPAGSLLCGSKSFIENARSIRKVLGGGMRQVGILAAAGLIALKEIVPSLHNDHRRTYAIAKAINDLNSKIITVNLDEVQTNMLFVKISSDKITSRDFVQRLKTTNSNHDDDKIIVRGMALTPHSARFVLYYEIDDEMVSAAIRKFSYVIKELEN